MAGPVGLVLAAGAGSRYGKPKILVPGWLDTAVGALADGGCTSVHVLTGAARPPLPAGAEEVHVPGWASGIGATVRAGIEHLLAAGDPQEVALHVVDCPDIGADVVARVLGAGDGLRRAVFDGRPGHPVVVPRAHLRPLLATLTDPDGAGPYLRSHPHVTVECGDLASATDVDHRP